jgi:hypothetical protein
MSSVIIQIDLPLPSGIKIGPAHRIEGRKGHGKDPLPSRNFIEGVDRIDGASRPGGKGARLEIPAESRSTSVVATLRLGTID